jgi:hypothetical protein
MIPQLVDRVDEVLMFLFEARGVSLFGETFIYALFVKVKLIR